MFYFNLLKCKGREELKEHSGCKESSKLCYDAVWLAIWHQVVIECYGFSRRIQDLIKYLWWSFDNFQWLSSKLILQKSLIIDLWNVPKNTSVSGLINFNVALRKRSWKLYLQVSGSKLFYSGITHSNKEFLKYYFDRKE